MGLRWLSRLLPTFSALTSVLLDQKGHTSCTQSMQQHIRSGAVVGEDQIVCSFWCFPFDSLAYAACPLAYLRIPNGIQEAHLGEAHLGAKDPVGS